MSAPRTLYDKIWDDHLVDQQDDGTCLLYIDRHLVHEVTSPPAFEGLRMTFGRSARLKDARGRRPQCADLARSPSLGIKNEESRIRSSSWRSTRPSSASNIIRRATSAGHHYIIGPEQGGATVLPWE